MKFCIRMCTACLFALVLTQQVIAERMTPEKLFELARVGDAVVSPDGSQVAYLVTRYALEDNFGTSSLIIQDIPAAGTKAKESSLAFETPLYKSSSVALLSDIRGLGALSWISRPEGAHLLYIAPGKVDADKEKEEETPQAWLLNPSSKEAVQITKVPGGISNLKPSPTGDSIAFTIDVKLDQTVNDLYEDLPKADARIIDSLLYRHWNQWHDYKYSHVCVAKFNDAGVCSDYKDLMEGMKYDCPVPPFGGAEQFNFSPDGKQIALTLKLVDRPAESTDTSVYLVSTEGGEMENIAEGMPGYDMEPSYSPDGKTIAFQSMRRASFESDRNRIMLYDLASKSLREVTSGLDQMTHSATWSLDGSSLYFDSETRGTQQVFSIDKESSELTKLSKGRFNYSVVEPVVGSNWLLVRQQSMLRPTELALVDTVSGAMLTITDVNGEVYKSLELPKVEQRFFTATDGERIHSWVILPPDYNAEEAKKWPMLTYCQGGPQGQIGQWFSYRWNFHMMAAKGYVVLAVNRRGLPGFGREWNDQISGDWGGQAMQDILSATDGMLKEPTIDPEKVAAIGASFGGYTVYWLMGNGGDRFCSMIAHCGVYNLESMYGSTEELFFVNWDLGGPYWNGGQTAADYQRFSPHKFAGNWKTPLLVIHGEKDFRVPVTQGMEAFTAAQVQNVPSRFLYFPEEGHWVQKPQNGVLWGRVFFDWLDRYCQPK